MRNRMEAERPVAFGAVPVFYIGHRFGSYCSTPVADRLKAPSREIETLIRLMTPTVKRPITNAELFLLNTHRHPSISPTRTRRSDGQRTGVVLNELHPVPHMITSQRTNRTKSINIRVALPLAICQLRDCRQPVYHRCRFPEGGGGGAVK